MHLSYVKIGNFRSFNIDQTIEFRPGFNIVLGANNAGKTSLLETLKLDYSIQEPHRTIASMPDYGDQPTNFSRFEYGLTTSFEELRRLSEDGRIFVPFSGEPGHVFKAAIDRAIGENLPLQFISTFQQGSIINSIKVPGISTTLGVSSADQLTLSAVRIDYDLPTSPKVSIAVQGGIWRRFEELLKSFQSRVYRFGADRRPAPRSSPGEPVLLNDASNLPFCINHLQTSDAEAHRRLCSLVARIFPSVQWIQSPWNNAAGQFEINCLPLPPESRRYDLSTSLARMGSGIGNVIAMLYVALTARHPQVIVIDEPNAFLHPRALRELMSILAAEGKEHQYILAGHSADILTGVTPATISLLTLEGFQTIARQAAVEQLHSLRGELGDLGIRMTDLHGKDRVLWVEGQTEEIVLPILLEWACPGEAAGTAVLRVEHTGTFSRKGVKIDEVAKIYQRLSSASALVPPMVCILLDRELYDAEKRAAIAKLSEGTVRLLQRRMLENYLLHPSAIAASIGELEARQFDASLIKAQIDELMKGEDINGIDAASVLGSIYSDLTEARHEFKKTRDVLTLVEWILKNDPEHLVCLREELQALFETA